MPNQGAVGADKGSTAWGAIVVIAGLLVVAGAFTGAVLNFNDAKDMVAVLGSVTGVVGTIVTAFFGIHAVASAGTDASSKVSAAGLAATTAVTEGHQNSNNQALAFAGAATPEEAAKVLDRLNITSPTPPQGG